MAPSPRGPRSPAELRQQGDEHVDGHAEHPTTSTDEDEITPIMSSGRDRGRNYRTTVLTTHAEASVETSPDLAPGKLRRESGGGRTAAAAASGTSPKPGSLNDSMRRERRKGRHSNPSAAATDGAVDDHEADDAYAGHPGGAIAQWWRGVVDKYGSVELDNKGSVARDHLALERTFLAWLRTSLSFASIGIAITQLFRLNTTITDREGLQPAPPPETGDIVRLRQMGKPLGAVFLAIAIIVLLVGSRRYFESQHWIIRGKFPASRGSVILITFVAVSLIVASLAIVLVVSPTQFEN